MQLTTPQTREIYLNVPQVVPSGVMNVINLKRVDGTIITFQHTPSAIIDGYTYTRTVIVPWMQAQTLVSFDESQIPAMQELNSSSTVNISDTYSILVMSIIPITNCNSVELVSSTFELIGFLPLDFARWATSNVAQTLPEPDENRKNNGWLPEERPPVEYFNWQWKRTYEICRYLDARVTMLMNKAIATPSDIEDLDTKITNEITIIQDDIDELQTQILPVLVPENFKYYISMRYNTTNNTLTPRTIQWAYNWTPRFIIIQFNDFNDTNRPAYAVSPYWYVNKQSGTLYIDIPNINAQINEVYYIVYK